MAKLIPALLALGLILITPALALETPTLTMPTEGAALPPNFDVAGQMPGCALVVVLTDVINCDTDEVIQTVPGIRHYTNSDGSFHFRVAAPRVSFGDSDTPLRYRVRVFEATRTQTGPEQVVMTQCVSPEMASWTAQTIPTSQSQPTLTRYDLGASSSMNAPVLTSPAANAALGPNYTVAGHMPRRAFLVVLTDVIRSDTGEVMQTVPGLRNWTRADGSFSFRVASPRIFAGDTAVPVEYRVRVFESGPNGNGPETVINATAAQ